MRLAALALLLALFVAAAPAEAQRVADLPGPQAPVALTDSPARPGLSLGQLFNAQTLDLSHSYELSYGGGYGGSIGLGVFTSTLRWQPTDRLAGRVDVGVAHSPFGLAGVQSALGFEGSGDARVFLRNAELAYRPTQSSMIHLRVQQSPYGSYAAPYGYASPYGFGHRSARTGLSATFGPPDSDRLFFRDGE